MSPLPSARLASSIDFYTRYTAMTVIHQREPDLPSARKVAWLSDRTRPFALVLVQSDDPADTPLGPFGHLGVACATQAEIDEKVALARREGVLRREPEQLGDPVGYFAFFADPDGNTLGAVVGAAGGTGSHPGGKTRRIISTASPGRITLQRDTSATRSMAMGDKKSGNPVDTAAKIAPLDNKAYEKALRKLHVELVKLQRWVVHKGLKVCIVFEGRDGAGKAAPLRPSPSASARVSSGSSPYPRPPSAKKASSTFSAISSISRRPAKS